MLLQKKLRFLIQKNVRNAVITLRSQSALDVLMKQVIVGLTLMINPK